MIKVSAAIIEKDNKILIARRKAGKHLAGLWEFPGGKIEAGESPEACLGRELKEEFGIEAEIRELVAENEHHYEGRDPIRLLAYRTVWLSGDFVPSDHSEIAWVGTEEMDNYDFSPADIPIVRKLQYE